MARKRHERMDIRDVLTGCFGFSGRTTMKELRRQTGRSRQALWKHLQKLLQSGELVIVRGEPGWAYAPGPGWPSAQRGALRGTVGREWEWWAWLTERVPFVAYINLSQIAVNLVTRRQASDALANLDSKSFIFADFEGVESVTDAFAVEMFATWPQGARPSPVPINMAPDVAIRVRRAQNLQGVCYGSHQDD